MVRRIAAPGLLLAWILACAFVSLSAQEEEPRILDADASHRFLPDRVPMETEMIPVDVKNCSVLQFPDKTRAGIAGLVTASLGGDMQQKYQYVLVSETKLKFERWTLPAGMVGLSLDGDKETPTRALIARDFNGSVIDRLTLKLDAAAPASTVSLAPKGKDFTMHIGKYVIQGSQK